MRGLVRRVRRGRGQTLEELALRDWLQVAAFVGHFCLCCAQSELELRGGAAPPAADADVAAREAGGDVEEERPPRAAEAALEEAVANMVSFEASMVEMLYADGRAQLVEADGGEAEGSLLVLELLQRAYQPQVAPSLRSLHALARGARCEALRSLRTRLRLLHPSIIGLREELVSVDGVPCATLLEASWIYAKASDLLTYLLTC